MLFVQFVCFSGDAGSVSLINNLATASAITGSEGVAVLIQPMDELTAVKKRRCELTAFLANLTLSSLFKHGSRLILDAKAAKM